MTKPQPAPESNTSSPVGRGLLVLTFAKGWFVLSGLTLLFMLPRLGDGSEEDRAALFGTYSVVVAILNPLTMMVIAGTLQATSKFISENPRRYARVLGRSLRLQSILGLVLAVGLLLGAPVLAILFNDEGLTSPLRHAAPILFFYALYAVFIGGFNGTKRFVIQGLMDILFASLKIGLILGAVALGFGVVGAISGFALTAFLLTLIAGLLSLFYTRRTTDQATEGITSGQLVRFQVWIMLYALALNLLLNADLYVVKALCDDATTVGVYSAALQVARLPYVAVISVTFVLFPLVSQATFAEDISLARKTIERALRGSLRVLGPLALVLSACAADVLRLVFPSLYAAGADQLSALSVGYFFFALVAILGTIFSAAGRPQLSTALMAASLLLSLACSSVGMYLVGPTGAAVGMMLALMIGSLLAGITLHRRLRPSLPWATLLRLFVAGAVVFGLSSLWHPEGKALIVVKGVAIMALYLGLLIPLKEFTRDDWRWLKQRLRKSSQAKAS